MTKERFLGEQEVGHRSHQVSRFQGVGAAPRALTGWSVFRNSARLLGLEYQDQGETQQQERGQPASVTTALRVPGWGYQVCLLPLHSICCF